MRGGTAPERFLVGLAVLSLLSDVSEGEPLLCVVDDAQWMDRASAQVLGFVGRRLLAESVALVFGSRERSQDLLGLPELEVTGLKPADAHALLNSVTHVRIDQHIRDRFVAETRGNPLALLELPRELAVTRMAGGFGLLDADTLPGRIERSFLARIEALPEQTRLLLLVAAAEPVGDPSLVWRAAERLGVTPATVLANGTDGLLSFDVRVIFRHPLVRSAVYGSAKEEDRRAVHLALAEVTDAQVDPDRRAWHLASATAAPDESVAAELEQSRGGLRQLRVHHRLGQSDSHLPAGQDFHPLGALAHQGRRGGDPCRLLQDRLHSLPRPRQMHPFQTRTPPAHPSRTRSPRGPAIQPGRSAHRSWKQQYALRSGIEGTISQAVRGFHLRRSRYLGLATTHLQHVLTAAAINLARVDAWLTATPLATSRRHVLEKLQAAATA